MPATLVDDLSRELNHGLFGGVVDVLCIANNPIERCAQFMGDGRQELRLVFIGLFDFVVALDQVQIQPCQSIQILHIGDQKTQGDQGN